MRLQNEYALIDAAYAIKFTPEYKKLLNLPKRYKYTVITYFRSKDLIYYEALKALRNVNILHSSDYGSIENALKVIAQSEYVISESLHGAIIADALRVPWARLNFYLQNPGDKETAEFKWADWARSLNLNAPPTLEIPLRFPQWISRRRNTILKPLRTMDYLNNFHKNLKYTLSANTTLSDRTSHFMSCIQNLEA